MIIINFEIEIILLTITNQMKYPRLMPFLNLQEKIWLTKKRKKP